MSAKTSELAAQCALRGIAALEQFLGRRVQGAIRAPRWCAVGPRARARAGRSASARADRRRGGALRAEHLLSRRLLGVFSDIEGAETGRLGMLLARDLARPLVERLVRAEGVRREWLECSALLEAANVAFSAAVGSLATAVGDAVFPSVPRFCVDLAAELASPGREVDGAYAVETLLAAADGGAPIPVIFVWVPGVALPDAMLSG
jgi:hypothetical protein